MILISMQTAFPLQSGGKIKNYNQSLKTQNNRYLHDIHQRAHLNIS
jgi:hypothetical protein